MPGLHALQKILRAHAHPRPETVSPGEYLEIDLGTDGRVTRVWFGGY